MAVDTRQKRMSAVMVVLPWRGAMVDASQTGFTEGNRQAAAFCYSGIAAHVPQPCQWGVDITNSLCGVEVTNVFHVISFGNEFKRRREPTQN